MNKVNIPCQPSTLHEKHCNPCPQGFTVCSARKVWGLNLIDSVTLKRSEKGTLDCQVGHQGELCGRVGLEEILALGRGLNRDPPPPKKKAERLRRLIRMWQVVPAWWGGGAHQGNRENSQETIRRGRMRPESPSLLLTPDERPDLAHKCQWRTKLVKTLSLA